jgi:hypothetical protein
MWKELSELIITGEFSEDDITDMRYHNMRGNEEQSKYATYWQAMEKVVELQGVGAHARRHATKQLEESVGGVGYTAAINSIKELMRRTNETFPAKGQRSTPALPNPLLDYNFLHSTPVEKVPSDTLGY